MTPVSGSWTSPALEGGGDAVAVWAAEQLAGLADGVDALCVATLAAGAHESVAFWRESLETGLAFANPRAFPWTLANSPTGAIAARLGVRGPTFTLVGRADALAGAFEHAREELAAGRATAVLVAALVLTRDGTVVDPVAGANGEAGPTASELLAEAIEPAPR